MHRRRSRVIAAAKECEFQSALPSDRLDRGKRLSQFFQNRPLLDVKFNVSEAFRLFAGVAQTGLRNFRRIQAKLLDRFPHGNPPGILYVQQFLVEQSHQRPAADERYTEANSLLF